MEEILGPEYEGSPSEPPSGRSSGRGALRRSPAIRGQVPVLCRLLAGPVGRASSLRWADGDDLDLEAASRSLVGDGLTGSVTEEGLPER